VNGTGFEWRVPISAWPSDPRWHTRAADRTGRRGRDGVAGLRGHRRHYFVTFGPPIRDSSGGTLGPSPPQGTTMLAQ
jgi:hypothetical protein